MKKFSDRFSGFGTIPECDSQPPSHVAVAITLNAKASSLKMQLNENQQRHAHMVAYWVILVLEAKVIINHFNYRDRLGFLMLY